VNGKLGLGSAGLGNYAAVISSESLPSSFYKLQSTNYHYPATKCLNTVVVVVVVVKKGKGMGLHTVCLVDIHEKFRCRVMWTGHLSTCM
jgi:diphthamide biosynthesis methyltransferase